MLRRFLIERALPGVGGLSAAELGEVARISNAALERLSGIQWQHSRLARDRSFCIHLADSGQTIREHARLAGIPVDRIVEIPRPDRPGDRARRRPRPGLGRGQRLTPARRRPSKKRLRCASRRNGWEASSCARSSGRPISASRAAARAAAGRSPASPASATRR